mgnify:FL=1
MRSSKKKKTRRFLAMWDTTGLEFIEDLTSIEEGQTWAILKGEEPPEYPPLNVLIMRARFNSHRHYEIYIFETGDFTLEELKKLFEFSPQAIVDAIRNTGNKLYSDRASVKQQVIV